ncbi:probable protein phosphatase 2C 4 isoform X2 [Amaranthus tricolor]|uniref:probable protein phosphatase 2C 4 isoform X2 n=1 Tax=Amaranthus tricolor TaxID=29722 RepID=UPI002585EF84|nr:probable protein phosphatase 2C 4 isoform X2 [Amaranthus tricolor]
MGNGIGKIGVCFTGSTEFRRSNKHEVGLYMDQYDEGLGHSFCYVRPDPTRFSNTTSSKIHSEESATGVSIFRSISGASVSANTSTPLSTAFMADPTATSATAAFFESSTSFASVPLQPIPRGSSINSGPLSGSIYIDRGFMSGPIERGGFLSGPLDRAGPALFSGPLDRSLSVQGNWPGLGLKPKNKPGSLIRGLRHAISKTFGQSSVAPVKSNASVGQDNWVVGGPGSGLGADGSGSLNMSSDMSIDHESYNSWESQNLQWAQGKAGEDRVHVVVSEEHGWVFVGIYDGFNGPDATDFLLSNLYTNVQKELKGLLWDDNSKFDSSSTSSILPNNSFCSERNSIDIDSYEFMERQNSSESSTRSGIESSVNGGKRGRNPLKSKFKGANKKWEENQRRWKCEWDRERVELDRRLKEQWNSKNGLEGKIINHNDVLKALSIALKKTEDSYLDIADKMVDENPELALMGSCVLGMLMKGEDVYLMNVGDSRAVLAQKKEPDLRLGKVDHDLERINEESMYDFEVSDGVKASLRTFQLTLDHCTCVEEEVQRIRDEHPDDAFAIVNDRVKGSLKVTRAFGAGFLKQPKWNDALLEMFRIDYVGTSPYISCLPFLYHHRLGLKDQFLILSSDGLYQYFTNEEVVAEVELFISLYPEGDPAQHLVEEVLFRAAKKAGMDFHELLEIPQGDRRRYHDDVSIIIISFEGRIWRSCV